MKSSSYLHLTEKYFLSYKIIFFQLALVVMYGIKILFPLFTKYIIDYLFVQRLTKFNLYILLLFFVLMSLYTIINLNINKLFLKYLNSRTKKMRLDFISKIFFDEKEFYATKPFSDIVYRLTNDLSNVTNSWTVIFGSLPAQLISIIPIFLLIKGNNILILLTFGTIVLNSVLLFLHLIKIENITKKSRDAGQYYNHQLTDKVSRYEEICSLGIMSKSIDKIKDSITALNGYTLEYFYRNKKFEVFMYVLNTTWSIVMLFIGAFLINNNTITLGTLIAFITLSNMIFQPISSLISTLKNLKDIKNSAERIVDFFPIEKSSFSSLLSPEVNTIRSISCNNISIFDSSKKTLLKDISFSVSNPGIYCITGANGVGKTTFAKCLIKQCKRYSGDICYNEININDIDFIKLKQKIIYFNSNDAIFDESLKWNICFNDESFNLSQYSWLIPHSLRKKLYNGFETILNNDILKLSNGEKQIIYFLRTLYLNPDVLIIDEPETAIDISVISKIKYMLNELAQDKIIILITHSNDFLQITDKKKIFDFNKVKS